MQCRRGFVVLVNVSVGRIGRGFAVLVGVSLYWEFLGGCFGVGWFTRLRDCVVCDGLRGRAAPPPCRD